MSDEPLPFLWDVDSRVLTAIVRATEVDGEDFLNAQAIFTQLGVTAADGARSVRRLVDNGYVKTAGDAPGRNAVGLISGVTERGLVRSGAWPSDADRLADQIIAALAEAAENEPEPERRSRLQRAASGVAGVGRDVLAETLAAIATRSMGMG
ncbi:hypothetical protein H7X46_00210 [Pseudonocardia sp. C8]|uniref:hypothetical protein n=1 Tax=Pseudonocardia sp. C8 TaxID=2762759 RepID=UPI001642C279|nr:hypothetical protein [Pseudonocardia sp. C8]MBC3189492.1 hypothetical protein [Pseudonocardia sp. C8]